MKGHNFGICKKCGKKHIHPKGMLGKQQSNIYTRSDKLKKKLSELAQKRTGNKNMNWKGGVRLFGKYIYVYAPSHPNCTKQGYILEHRLVMESKLGRFLEKGEIVHHKNNDSLNNSPENLELFSSFGKHYITCHVKRDFKGRFKCKS